MKEKPAHDFTVEDLGTYSRDMHVAKILNPFYIHSRSRGPLNGTYAAKGVTQSGEIGVSYYHDEDAILKDARNLGKIYPDGMTVWPLSNPECGEWCTADRLMPALLDISEKRASDEKEKTRQELEEIKKKLNEPASNAPQLVGA